MGDSSTLCKICNKFCDGNDFLEKEKSQEQDQSEEDREKVLNLCREYLFRELCDWNLICCKESLPFCVECFGVIAKLQILEDKCKIQKNDIQNFCNKFAMKVLKLRNQPYVEEFPKKNIKVTIKMKEGVDQEIMCKICHEPYREMTMCKNEYLNLTMVAKVIRTCKKYLFPEIFDDGSLELHLIARNNILPFCFDCCKSIQELFQKSDRINTTLVEIENLVNNFSLKILSHRKSRNRKSDESVTNVSLSTLDNTFQDTEISVEDIDGNSDGNDDHCVEEILANGQRNVFDSPCNKLSANKEKAAGESTMQHPNHSLLSGEDYTEIRPSFIKEHPPLPANLDKSPLSCAGNTDNVPLSGRQIFNNVSIFRPAIADKIPIHFPGTANNMLSSFPRTTDKAPSSFNGITDEVRPSFLGNTSSSGVGNNNVPSPFPAVDDQVPSSYPGMTNTVPSPFPGIADKISVTAIIESNPNQKRKTNDFSQGNNNTKKFIHPNISESMSGSSMNGSLNNVLCESGHSCNCHPCMAIFMQCQNRQNPMNFCFQCRNPSKNGMHGFVSDFYPSPKVVKCHNSIINDNLTVSTVAMSNPSIPTNGNVILPGEELPSHYSNQKPVKPCPSFIQSHNTSNKIKSFCSICFREFMNPYLLHYHLQSHFDDVSPETRCDICKKVFTHSWGRNRHFKTRHPEQFRWTPAKWSYDGAEMLPVSETDLNRQEEGDRNPAYSPTPAQTGISTREKNGRYACSICPATFFWLTDFRSHQLGHYDTAP